MILVTSFVCTLLSFQFLVTRLRFALFVLLPIQAFFRCLLFILFFVRVLPLILTLGFAAPADFLRVFILFTVRFITFLIVWLYKVMKRQLWSRIVTFFVRIVAINLWD